MLQNKKAFTLIELLIVIAIIGILSSVVLVSLSNSRSKARDAQRKSDVAQMAKLLQVYRASTGNAMFANVAGYGFLNSVYTATLPHCSGTCTLTFNQGLIANGAPERVAGYAFSDPRIQLGQHGTTHNYMISTCSNGRYVIFAELENPNAESDATVNRAISAPYSCGVCYTDPSRFPGACAGYFMNYAVVVE